MSARIFARAFEADGFFGLSRDMVAKALRSFIRAQDHDGIWSGGTYPKVQTAQAVRIMGALGYTNPEEWRDVLGAGVQLDLERPLEYCREELRQAPKKKPRPVAGDDLWDHCQFVMAVAAHDGARAVELDVRTLESRWSDLFNRDAKAAAEEDNDWFGPATLAAIIDVMLRCGGTRGTMEAIAAKLAEFVVDDAPGVKFDRQPGTEYLNRWHTGLVLRTLALCPDLVPLAGKIQPAAEWLLSKQQDEGRWSAGPQLNWRPMFTSRAAQGLLAVLPMLDDRVAEEVRFALERANRWLEEAQAPDGSFVDVKSTITALEYFSSYRVPLAVPVAALLSEEAKAPGQVFVGHSFDPSDIHHGQAAAEALCTIGVPVESGERWEAGTIPDLVKQRIDASSTFLGIFSAREQKRSGTWSPPRWVVQEMNYASAKGLRLVLFRETGEKEVPPDEIEGGLVGNLKVLPYDPARLDRLVLDLQKLPWG